MKSLGWDRRTFLAWAIGAPLLLALRPTAASEAAIAILQIDGMT